jgi:hypothetical protein
MQHKDRDFSVTPQIAADGIDEFLDVFVAASRAAHDAPPGPTIISSAAIEVTGGGLISQNGETES